MGNSTQFHGLNLFPLKESFTFRLPAPYVLVFLFLSLPSHPTKWIRGIFKAWQGSQNYVLYPKLSWTALYMFIYIRFNFLMHPWHSHWIYTCEMFACSHLCMQKTASQYNKYINKFFLFLFNKFCMISVTELHLILAHNPKDRLKNRRVENFTF